MTDILDDIKKAIEEIEKRPSISPKISVHHPKCKALETNDWLDCNCGGWAYD